MLESITLLGISKQRISRPKKNAWRGWQGKILPRKILLVLWDKAQTKEKYDGYFEEDLECKRNGWAGHCDRGDRTDNWSGHLGPGGAVPAVEGLRLNGNRYTN